MDRVGRVNIGEYDIFLEDNTKNNYSEYIQKGAYKLDLLKNLEMESTLKTHILYEYSRIINNIPIQKCLNGKMFFLSDEEKKEIENEISEKVMTLLIRSKTYFIYGIPRSLNIHFLTNKYTQEDIFKYIKNYIFPEPLNIREKIPYLNGFENKDHKLYNNESILFYRESINKLRNYLKMSEEDAIKSLKMIISEKDEISNKYIYDYLPKYSNIMSQIKKDSENIEKPNLTGISCDFTLGEEKYSLTLDKIKEGLDKIKKG